jgi:trans-2,3-dihydro-3-hydroxyanthranilate isomerase
MIEARCSYRGGVSRLAYEVVDVFTDRPFTGNPLAVVFGADGLAKDQMQALAREFNLSETVFALPPTADGATYRARIFTPNAELPFAGHPSVGVAVTQLRRGLIPAGRVWQECGAGVLAVEVSADGQATIAGGRANLGPELDPEELVAAIGLGPADLAGSGPRIAGCGLDFPYLAVTPEALVRARVPSASLDDICVFAWDEASQVAHVRVFAPGMGVPEDPATGSAALGMAVYLVATGRLPRDGESSFVVHQGEQVHRPSVIRCSVSAVDGEVTAATITGSVVPIAAGEIAVPPFVG